MEYEILGIFSAYTEKGWTTNWHRLIFTTDGIVVAKEEKSGLGKIFSLRGGGEPEYIFSRASTRDRMRVQQISAKRVEDTLKANPENFEIKYSDITVTEATPYVGPDYVLLRIFTESLDVPKYEFKIKSSRRYFGDIEHLLQTVLPGKV